MRFGALAIGFIVGIVVAAALFALVFVFIAHLSTAALLALCLLVILIWGVVSKAAQAIVCFRFGALIKT